jgi:hypothetical protein
VFDTGKTGISYQSVACSYHEGAQLHLFSSRAAPSGAQSAGFVGLVRCTCYPSGCFSHHLSGSMVSTFGRFSSFGRHW